MCIPTFFSIVEVQFPLHQNIPSTIYIFFGGTKPLYPKEYSLPVQFKDFCKISPVENSYLLSFTVLVT